MALCASDAERVRDIGGHARAIAGVRKDVHWRVDGGPHTEIEC